MGDRGEADVHPHTDGDTETLRCVKVALPITASVSFRAASVATGVDEDWRSLATETGPRPQEVLQLAAVAVTASSPALVVDDSPTDVMTRLWWVPPKAAQLARPALWEPPVPIVPQLPLELLPRPAPTVERTVLRPSRKATSDSRAVVAPLSLLLVALSVVPPVANAPASSARARTVSVAMHEADTTQPVVCPPAPVVAPVVPADAPVVPAAAPVVHAAAPVTVAAQRRLTVHVPHRASPPPRSGTHLVRDVPF
jgi:hypothetical protein